MAAIVRHTENRIREITLKITEQQRTESAEPKVVYIEGLDRTGKDTLLTNIVRDYPGIAHKNYISVRGPISMIVYNRLYKRGVDDECYWAMIPRCAIIVYLALPLATIQERILATGHEHISLSTLLETSMHYKAVIAEAEARGVEVFNTHGEHEPSKLAQLTTEAINK
jgi:thymidylate kinase